jgi:glutaconate CoA-transferase subunit A
VRFAVSATARHLLAMPALALDVAIVHVDRADERGNAQDPRPRPVLRRSLLAPRQSAGYLSCENVVSTDELLDAGCVHTIVIDRGMVDGVAEIPFGAHPTSCVPAYGMDLKHLKAYSAAAERRTAGASTAGVTSTFRTKHYVAGRRGPSASRAAASGVLKRR